FLIDIATDELDGVSALLKQQPGVRSTMERLPLVAGRLESVNGVSSQQLRSEQAQDGRDKKDRVPRHLLQSVPLTWSDTVPAGTKVHAGAWWAPGAVGKLAISERLANRMHVGIGSTVVFSAQERR